MSTDRERKLEEARATFKQLYAEDSGVRSLTEATRANDADTYNPNATLNAFSHGLSRSVKRLGQVSDIFTAKK